MNVLIVGNSDINEPLGRRLRDEGFSFEAVPDSAGVVRMKGRPGAFELNASGKKYRGGGVIVTEQPYTDGSELFDAHALNLLLPGIAEKLKTEKGRKKIVFLLDYCEETPEWLTVRAYEAAILLAAAKKDVVFLSMFAKAASAGMEKLYLKARQAGVTFIKYERASAEYDAGVFTVSVNDGVFDTVIEAPYLLTAGTRNDSVLAFLGDKFRVSDKKEIVSEFKYFLNPALTTRKGVYLIHNNLDAALPYITAELRQIEADGSGYEATANGGGEAAGGTGSVHATANSGNPAAGKSTVHAVDNGGSNPAAGANAVHAVDNSGYPAAGASAVHAVIDAGKCAFCYSCYRACPHAALEPDLEAGAMACIENACMACGVCAAICPGEAIVMSEETWFSTIAGGAGQAAKGTGMDCFGAEPLAMTKSEPLAMTASGSRAKQAKQKRKADMCKVFCCENSAAPAFAEIMEKLGGDAGRLDLQELPCGGRLGHELITDALSSYDKVLVAVCIDGACRHMNGGKRACNQTERVNAELEKAGLEGSRVEYVQVSHAMPGVLLENVRAFLGGANATKSANAAKSDVK